MKRIGVTNFAQKVNWIFFDMPDFMRHMQVSFLSYIKIILCIFSCDVNICVKPTGKIRTLPRTLTGPNYIKGVTFLAYRYKYYYYQK